MKRNIIITYSILFIICNYMTRCGRIGEGKVSNTELIPLVVSADFETEALKNPSKNEDAADDPAVWINKENPEKSYIIGTDKTAGLAVYNLKGEEIYFYADGRMNNVDVRYDFPYKGDKIDIVACSNRSENTISFYQIHKDGSLSKLKADGFDSPMENDVYGFALGKYNDIYYAYVNSKKGELIQWKITSKENKIVGEIVRKLDFNMQLEGMVADDEMNTLFIGAEEKAIYYTSIEPSNKNYEKVVSSELVNNLYMKEDIEGLAIYRNDDVQYLLASSQGNFSYAVFNLKPPYNYIGSFRITDGIVDGVQETDGIEAVSVSLGEKYPKGIFIAQDGFNKDNRKSKAQNFKIINWIAIESQIKLMKK